MGDMDKGLYSKYRVTKADGTPLDGDCFVLRPDRDPAAVKALLAYAASTTNEELSSDIRVWLASIGADMDAPNEITALRAENAAYKADIDVGRLIRIPCREFFDGAGGTVWLLWGGEAIEMVHCGADIDAEGKLFAALVCEDKIFPYRDGDAGHDTEMSDWCTNTKYVSADEYAQTVFATEEAARAALGEEET